jgi:outer membrane protein TolC
LIGLERAQRTFVQVRDSIIADVRDAVRNIRSAQSTLQIQQRAVDLAQRRLEYSTELLVQGRVTDSREVVEAQQSLLQAQDQFDRARAELQIQVLNFLRDTGILRVDPDAGALGMALNREGADAPPAN